MAKFRAELAGTVIEREVHMGFDEPTRMAEAIAAVVDMIEACKPGDLRSTLIARLGGVPRHLARQAPSKPVEAPAPVAEPVALPAVPSPAPPLVEPPRTSPSPYVYPSDSADTNPPDAPPYVRRGRPPGSKNRPRPFGLVPESKDYRSTKVG